MRHLMDGSLSLLKENKTLDLKKTFASLLAEEYTVGHIPIIGEGRCGASSWRVVIPLPKI